TFISFLVIGLAPGGPLDFLTPEDPNASPEVKQRLIQEFGLDQPVPVQYWRWLTRVVHLDFGRTFLPDGKPVLTKIGERLPITLRGGRRGCAPAARPSALSARAVIASRARRSAVFPVVTVLGLSLPGPIGGSVFVESIFASPVMGQLMVQSVFSRDYP